jgi:hypothetical protein
MNYVLLHPCIMSTKMLVAICKNNQVFKLKVNNNSIESAMKYVNLYSEQVAAVLGILRFSLHMSIAMTDFDPMVVRDF